MATPVRVYLKILNYNSGTLWYQIAIAALYTLLYFISSYAAKIVYIPLIFSTVFTVLDHIGFSNLISENEKYVEDIEHRYTMLASYRTLQFTIHVLLLALIYVLFGWELMLAAEALHWFGWCDLLYYIIDKETVPKVWTWLKWTPIGFFVRPLPHWLMIVQVILGVIIFMALSLLSLFNSGGLTL